MNKRVWIFQYKQEVAIKGADVASWYVGWYDLHGKRHAESCGAGSRGKNLAEKRLRRIQGELDTGLHHPPTKITWAQFRNEYEKTILSRRRIGSKNGYRSAFEAFELHAKPIRMTSITTKMIDEFIAARQFDKGKKSQSRLSPATINKDLRMIKAALKRAVDWGYLPTMPKIRMVETPKKLPRYVTADHFELIYSKACELAQLPTRPTQTYSAAQWWRALVVCAYMTGWRINELLMARREDLDLDKRTIITRAANNKGKRDDILPLHPVAIDHLKQLDLGDEFLFRWPHDPRYLWVEFGRIQRAAGIHLHCSGEHEHTESCHVYGFHDFRRAFATINAPRLKPEALQKLMRHKSYTTTLGYIAMANQLTDAIADMEIPDVLRKENTASNDAAKKEPDDPGSSGSQ